MLLKNATIITQNKFRKILARGHILVADGLILSVGEGPYVGKSKHAKEIIDCSGYIITPGFINAHVHLGETIFTNLLTEHFTLETYLRVTNSIAKQSKLIENERNAICDYSLINILKSGTTTIAGGRTQDASQRFGMCNVSGYMLMQSPKLKKFSYNAEQQFDDFFKKIDDLFTRPALFIHSLATVSKEMLLVAGRIKKNHPNLPIMVHVAETKQTELAVKRRFKQTSVQTLSTYNLLDKHTLLIHANNLSQKDTVTIKDAGASIIHCLSSNLRVADNTPNIKALMNAGIPVSIATDGVATAGTFSMLGEAQRCYRYHNGLQLNNHHVSAQAIFDMITINPARVLGISKEVGSIEPNKRADLVLFKKESYYQNTSIHQLLLNDALTVAMVILNGKIIITQNKFIANKEDAIVRAYQHVVDRVQRKTSLRK